MAFLKKLKEADEEVKSLVVNITPIKGESKSVQRSTYRDNKQSISSISSPLSPMSPLSSFDQPEARSKQGVVRNLESTYNNEAISDSKNDENQYDNIDRGSILWKVSEYLFDLFDANCLDGYKKIEAFEDRVMKHFANDTEEYTFEQERCHREFLDLFESLIESFLKENKTTTQAFYAEVNLVMKQKIAHHNKEANEIVDVIFTYCDFKSWVEYMKEQTNNRFTIMEKISMEKKNAAKNHHRFESELK
jgi:hypothetical protein